jgi:serine/threonine-protein kinase HipA
MADLVVSVGGVRAGLLRRNNEGSIFELDEEYLALADRPVLGQIFEDSPDRPYRTRQGVPSWFANLLPEGPLRRLIAERAGVHERRSLFLLGLLGDDLPGAVVIHPSTDMGSEEEESQPHTVDADSDLRFSLAGVQLKFSAARDDRGLTIPARGQGGDWIVKLPDQRYDGVPENEYSMIELARRSGITVPAAQLVEVSDIEGLPEGVPASDKRALAVERFDRVAGGSRVHIEDFAQVLGLPPSAKYGATNYDTIVRVLAALRIDEDVDEILRRLVFMVGIGNSDAHAKNWSLIYPDGRTARLAPAYDLLAVSLYEKIDPRLKARLALKLVGHDTAETITEATFRRLAQRAHIDEERTIAVVRAQVTTIQNAWTELQRTSDTLEPQLSELLDERFANLSLFR